MDFKDNLKQLSERIEKLKENLPTEEATKTALIMPFIQVLGYDVFNPLEVLPEMVCDIGIRKNEKIDYAILKDGKPIILIECKHWKQDLHLHETQLLRYYTVSKAKFGVLTNGIIYRFYSDLKEVNRMDDKPFLEVNMLDLKDAYIDEVKKFHKSYFDIETIMSSASELKYTSELKAKIASEFASPSPDFVKYIGTGIYDRVFTANVIEPFTLLVKRSFFAYVNDLSQERLKAAIQDGTGDTPQPAAVAEIPADVVNDKIVTTDVEIEAFYIVKSILRPYVSIDRIAFRDAQTYCSILFDDNNRKPIVRMYLNSETNMQISFIGDDKKERKEKIKSLDDIYLHSDEIIGKATGYLH
jgi:hypothetical protein